MFNKILTSIILLVTMNAANAIPLYIDYDKLRELDDFNDKKLNKVLHISPSKERLTDYELNNLVKSNALINLKKLDLSGHKNLTDEHIEELCDNESSFAQLLELDLSDCPQITGKSLEKILKSALVGSIKNLPQISDQYGYPSSEILLIIGGKTKITKEEKKADYIFSPFTIKYQQRNGKPSKKFPTAYNGMKTLNIEY